MQMKNTMVNDAYSHPRFKNDTVQRKTIKRPKDTYKVGKTILKIQNINNLKNQVMLKNAVKCVDALKSEHFINGFNDELEKDALRHEEETYLQDICAMDLSLRNDSEFKIIEKLHKVSKPNTKQKNQNKKSHIENINVDKNSDNANSLQDILSIKCTIVKPSLLSLDTVSEEHALEDTVNDSETEQTHLKASTEEIKDLQTLLVMLAITPQNVENESEPKHDGRVNDGIKEVIPNNVIQERDRDDSALHHNIYDFFNVIPMRVEVNEREIVLMKKYADKWKSYVSKKKEILAKQREETLNSFFDKLTKRKSSTSDTPPVTPVHKSKLLARDYNRYRHRYQMQKHIIALQKAKLEEQNRIIEELKYNRIVEASKMSIETLRKEVRKTYYDMDRQLKPKLKCLTSELKVQIEEPSLVLHCLKVPQFLQRMEKRAREREEKHAMIRERRQQMEEERKRLKQQEELSKAQMDKDEKIKRMAELKDKRRREKIDNIRKKQHTERMRALNVMAELHYEKSLKAKYGIRPFRILIEIERDNIEKAKAHYKFQLKKNHFLNWMWYTEDMWFERNFKAEDFYRKKILRRAFGTLKQNHYNYVLKKQVAEDYYDIYVTKLVFRKFRAAIAVVKREVEIKFQMAITYYNSNLLFRAFCCWRTLPALNKLKREQEARKARWREKVLQVVPDYTPPED